MTKIKICGMRRPEDIAIVNEYQPDYIGYIFVKNRVREVSEEQAAMMTGLLDPSICPVGVFVDEDMERILRIVSYGTIRAVQLHGSENTAYVAALRKRLDEFSPMGSGAAPGSEIPIIKAVRMESGHSLDRWQKSEADYLLLDQGKGGTGTAFDHELIDEAGPIRKPWFLAGGIGAENAKEVIQRFAPYALDVSSSVETDGWKDREKVAEMILSVQIQNSPDSSGKDI
jgi:phosphoribosylanthranilate isomerase